MNVTVKKENGAAGLRYRDIPFPAILMVYGGAGFALAVITFTGTKQARPDVALGIVLITLDVLGLIAIVATTARRYKKRLEL